MTRTRFLILSVGPLLLIGGAYALSHPLATREQRAFDERLEVAEERAHRDHSDEADELSGACSRACEELKSRLPAKFAAIVHVPFVLAGDFSEAELDGLYRDTIQPVTEALWRCYFDRRPDRPVVIVALKNEPTYRKAALALDGYPATGYAGYTQRSQRRVVFNAATGTGTLMHELAHVLASFDFPDMPEWFDEGLASLHEEAVFSPDRLTLTGATNWRIGQLAGALRTGELPELEVVLRSHSFRGEGEGLNYAVVRGLCLYLQERGILSHFYRKFRAGVGSDPSGLQTLRELLGAGSVRDIDADFRKWIARQPAVR